METLMEGLVIRQRAMKSARVDWSTITTSTDIRGISAKQHDILRQDYGWNLVSVMDASKDIFWQDKRINSLNQLHALIFSPEGGVRLSSSPRPHITLIPFQLIAYIAHVLEDRFKLCFNNVQLDDKDIRHLMQQVKRDEPEAIKQLEKTYESLKDATCVTDAMTLKIHEAIEEAFVTTIAETSATNYLGNMSDITWVMAYKEYVSKITRMIEDIVSGMRADGSIDNIPEDVSIALTTCHLKIKVVIAHLIDKYHNFPFFCPSFLVSLRDHYSKISCAIFEVRPSIVHVHFHAEAQYFISA